MTMTDAYVHYSVSDQVATIEFYTQQHNSLPAAVLAQLADTIRRAGQDESARVIVLRSAGNKTFCAGASFDELMAIENEEKGLTFFSGFARVINAMRTCPKFIVGRVQGKAIGGGVGLACSCDYVFATEQAEIKLSELAVGIGPFVVGPAVERKIGTTAAYELAIDAGSFRSARWAQSRGMYASVAVTEEEMDKSMNQLVAVLAKSSAEAMREIKTIFWKGTENWDQLLSERAAISGRLILSDYSKTFLQQFKGKNK